MTGKHKATAKKKRKGYGSEWRGRVGCGAVISVRAGRPNVISSPKHPGELGNKMGEGGGSDIIEGKCYGGTFTALKGECFDGVIWGVTAVFTSVFCLYDKGICCCLNKTYCSYDQESVVVPQK